MQEWQNKKALIFDCDGTLVDSMPVHMRAWRYAIESMGAPYHEEFLLAQRGMREAEIVEEYNRKFSTNMDISETLKRKHDFYRANIHEIKPIEPVVEIVTRYYRKYPMAVASGSTRENVENSLRILDLLPYFRVLVTADDPVAPKPSPDIFLEAARRLRVAPEDCHVFEDGEMGIEAAKKAGMTYTDIREWF